MSSMASFLNIPVPCASTNKNACRWSMVPRSTRRAGNSMHGMVEPKLQRWLKGSGRAGIGTKRGDLSRVQCEDWSCGIPPPHYPVSTKETITRFYDLINQKDPHNQLPTLLKDDCHYTDLVFYIPFQGQQGVLNFLKQLMDAMGDNIKIKTEGIAEGESYSASVNWHLDNTILCVRLHIVNRVGRVESGSDQWHADWASEVEAFWSMDCTVISKCIRIKWQYGKNIRYPSQLDTTTSSAKSMVKSYSSSMEELPWKPGDYALRLLKAVSLFFDRFPAATELLLQADGKQEGLIVTILHFLGNDHHRSP